ATPRHAAPRRAARHGRPFGVAPLPSLPSPSPSRRTAPHRPAGAVRRPGAPARHTPHARQDPPLTTPLGLPTLGRQRPPSRRGPPVARRPPPGTPPTQDGHRS